MTILKHVSRNTCTNGYELNFFTTDSDEKGVNLSKKIQVTLAVSRKDDFSFVFTLGNNESYTLGTTKNTLG